MSYADADVDALLAAIDQMSDEELDALAAELEAEDEPYGDGGGGDDGPWHDGQAALLAAAGSALDLSYGTAAEVAAQDAGDAQWLTRRPSGEDKLLRAVSRIEAGTYTEPVQFRTDLASTQDRLGLSGGACGPVDDFGRCSARFHDRHCQQVIEAAAATGSADAASAWHELVLARTPDPDAILLATPEPWGGSFFWEDVFDSGGPDPMLHGRMMAALGEDIPPEAARPRLDLSAIKAAMGL